MTMEPYLIGGLLGSAGAIFGCITLVLYYRQRGDLALLSEQNEELQKDHRVLGEDYKRLTAVFEELKLEASQTEEELRKENAALLQRINDPKLVRDELNKLFPDRKKS